MPAVPEPLRPAVCFPVSDRQPQQVHHVATKPNRTALGADQKRLIRRISWLEETLDSRFSIFGYRVGLDGLIGLIPGIGDAVTTGISGYLVVEAWRAGASKTLIARMIGNVALDAVLGAIPLVGDLFDFAFKANARNARLLRTELERRGVAASELSGLDSHGLGESAASGAPLTTHRLQTPRQRRATESHSGPAGSGRRNA